MEYEDTGWYSLVCVKRKLRRDKMITLEYKSLYGDEKETFETQEGLKEFIKECIEQEFVPMNTVRVTIGDKQYVLKAELKEGWRC